MIIVTNIFCMITTVVVAALSASMAVPAMSVWFLMIVREGIMMTQLVISMPPVWIPVMCSSMGTVIMRVMTRAIVVMVWIGMVSRSGMATSVMGRRKVRCGEPFSSFCMVCGVMGARVVVCGCMVVTTTSSMSVSI